MQLVPIAEIAETEVEALLDAAFGADRMNRTAYGVRDGMPMLAHASIAAIEDGELIGSLQCWPVTIMPDDGTSTNLVMVGPVAVLPERQNIGIGIALMDEAMQILDRLAADPQVMIGDVEYYGRWDFAADKTRDWTLPGPFDPRRLLVRDPAARALPRTGVLGPRASLS